MYNHFVDWKESLVDPSVIDYNVTWLESEIPLEYLFSGLPLSERRNDGRVRDYWLRSYAFASDGGWWCSGEDILTGAESIWGCFKPARPRERKGKPLKYEHPPRLATEIFALRLDLRLEQAIYDRAGIAVNRTEPSFWQHARHDTRLPLYITEGAKKAGCLLSHGYAGIGLPGVNNGARRNKNQWGEYIGSSYLIPQLEAFDWQGRDCYFCFDQDSKPKTVRAVRKALKRLGGLLEARGAKVYVIQWDNSSKGVDDLVAAQGIAAFEQAVANALPLTDFYLSHLRNLDGYVTRRLCQPFISDLALKPDTQFLCLKSSRGTGKTELIGMIVTRANARGIRVLLITHRIQLSQNAAYRMGIDYVTERRTSPLQGALGYAMCIDSLHPDSAAQFRLEEWDGAIVVLDEIEQVLWHLFSSTTCKEKRCAILQNLQNLLRHVIATGGRIIIADADLTPVALRFVTNTIGQAVKTEVIDNQWTPAERLLHPYEQPEHLWQSLLSTIAAGEKAMVHCSAQKVGSLWSSQNIEKRLLEEFPALRVLRIDAESIADPAHAAYGCMGDINGMVQHYDVVVASPSLETGVSIDVRDHFAGVYAFCSGVQTTDAVCQTLARVRDPVPRHVYLAKRGMNRIGGGATTPKGVLNALDDQTRATMGVLRKASDATIFDELDGDFMPEALQAWAERAALVNAGCLRYRDTILRQLQQEGYKVASPVPPEQSCPKAVRQQMRLSRTELQEQHWEAVSNASSPSKTTLEQLKTRRAKTSSERDMEKKGTIERTYGQPVTPKLVARHDEGIYPRIRLHYYLTAGRTRVCERDRQVIQQMFDRNNGKIWNPDLVRDTYSQKVYALEAIGIHQFLDPDATFTSDSLREWAERMIGWRRELRIIFGITVSEKQSPIRIAQHFLALLGLHLVCYRKTRQQGTGTRLRHYKLSPPDDKRENIFNYWETKFLPATAETI